jgi:hypothetical protein
MKFTTTARTRLPGHSGGRIGAALIACLIAAGAWGGAGALARSSGHARADKPAHHPTHGRRPSDHSSHSPLYVSPRGKAGAICSKRQPCPTIAAAIAAAKPGARIIVLSGTYREAVKITERLTLLGKGRPVIDAQGLENAVAIAGPGAAGSRVEGFTAEHAEMEGILALSTSKVTIARNIVRENDQGTKAPKPTGECAPQGPVPGDCGEGLHLMGTSYAHVVDNLVTGNSGGILVTDETGPAAHNLIAKNRVLGNLYDCGITIAGHSTKALSASGALQPAQGGIYDNRVIDNVVNGNGVKGEGAGILLAVPAPGGGVYDNFIQGNTADGNGMAGITIHSHAPGQDLNGNRLIDNKLADDGIAGNHGGPGDVDAGINQTVAITIFSAVVPIGKIVVKANTISNVHFGIWAKNAPPISAGANHFKGVAVPVEAVSAG